MSISLFHCWSAGRGRKRNCNHLSDELHRVILYFTADQTMLISWFHCWSADALSTIPFPFLMSVYRVRSVAPFPRGVFLFSATLYFMISVSQRLCFAPRVVGRGRRGLGPWRYRISVVAQMIGGRDQQIADSPLPLGQQIVASVFAVSKVCYLMR